MLTRVLRTAAATLEHTFVVGEALTDSTETVTVTITDAAGTAVQSGDATSAGVGTGRYTVGLDPQAQLSMLTVAWSATIAGAAVVEVDQVEVVGGRFFTLAEGRAADPNLADTVKYPTARLAAALLETEVECEEICDRSFFPRYRREVLDGTGTPELMLPGHDIRSVRAVKVAPRVGLPFVALTVDELAALTVTDDGRLLRVTGATWTEGRDNVVVEYEVGLAAPPPDLVLAAKVRFRSRLNLIRTGIPDRAISYQTSDGANYRLDQPGAFKIGISEVDAAYARYSRRDGAGGEDGRSVPVSRQLDYNPQRYSLFHGGIR
ncbi:hypothetical protein [Actinophytocola sediminis]